MDVILTTGGVDVQECDLLTLGFFQDERPLRGAAGWVDWRLNGKLSRFCIEGKLTGEWIETTLIPSEGRVSPRMILLLGLGKVKEYGYLRIRELSSFLWTVLQKMRVPSTCVCLPCGEAYNVNGGKLMALFLEEGAHRVEEPDGFEEEWIKNLHLLFPEEEESFSEMLLGIQTMKSVLEHRFPFRILVPSEKNKSGSLPSKVAPR
jgi:hypothetical protein